MKLPSPTFVLNFLTYLLLLVLWQLFSTNIATLQLLLPPPSRIFLSFYEHGQLLAVASLITLGETLVGLILSVLVALPFTFLFDRFLVLKNFSYPLLIAWQSTPTLALAPLIALWFGFGFASKIAVVFFVCFFPILLSLLNGIAHVDKDLLNLFKSYQASNYQVFKLVKLPHAFMAFFSGLKIACSYAIGAAIAGEWIGGQHGLGMLLLRSRKSYDYALMYSTIILIIIFSFLLFKGAYASEKAIDKKYFHQYRS